LPGAVSAADAHLCLGGRRDSCVDDGSAIRPSHSSWTCYISARQTWHSLADMRHIPIYTRWPKIK